MRITFEQPLQRYPNIFSGKNSEDVWNAINKIKNGKTHNALYELSCKCQELENIVQKLERRIAQLENV